MSSGESDNTLGIGSVPLPFAADVQRIGLPVEPLHFLAPTGDEFIEGGGFLYENSPAIFLGRTGYGPLRMAWDSNVIIDYAEFGDLMWDDREFDPPISEPRYLEELVALNTLVQLWMVRDMRKGSRAPD